MAAPVIRSADTPDKIRAGERGIRVMLEPVVNHTSDQHLWFQSARSDLHCPYRDWHVWSETEPSDRSRDGVPWGGERDVDLGRRGARLVPGRFYRFEPDLNTDNPAVHEEIQKIAMF